MNIEFFLTEGICNITTCIMALCICVTIVIILLKDAFRK